VGPGPELACPTAILEEGETVFPQQRLIGIVLVVVGVILLYVGMNASQSVVDQVSQTFAGRFTERTTWYIVGGIAAAILGLLMVFVGGRRRLA
jgi:uncharacterized membrane protein YidH (DUF202 family)